MKSLILFIVLTAIANADYRKSHKKLLPPTSHVCPPNFVRTKHNKCYYFSRNEENFDHAYWSCVTKHSTLAVIRGRNQDNTLRRLLNKNKIQHVERWIGARYNWERKKWQWAANGKLLNYTGFQNDPIEADGWQCIILDPKLQYKWNYRGCLEKKHFICQTRLKKTNILLSPNERNFTKFDKNLNEVLPEVSNNDIPSSWVALGDDQKSSRNAIGKTSLAYSPKITARMKGNKRKGKGRKRKYNIKENKDIEAQQDAPVLKEGPVAKNIKYVTYHGASAGPLHPRIIVEDFDFLKNETAG